MQNLKFYKLNFKSRQSIFIESTTDYFSFIVQLEVAPFFLKMEKKVRSERKDPRIAVVKGELSSVEVTTLAKISDKETKQQDSLYKLVT